MEITPLLKCKCVSYNEGVSCSTVTKKTTQINLPDLLTDHGLWEWMLGQLTFDEELKLGKIWKVRDYLKRACLHGI